MFMKIVLKQLKMQFIVANDGVEAVDKFKAEKFDVVLMDENMPNMNGLELVKKIRGGGAHQKTPIVMITTEGGKGEVITALKAGVNNYIVKPFTPQILQEKLKDVL